MGIWTIIQYVDTPLTLLAFILAILAWIYSMKLKSKAKLLKTLPESERAAYLEKELEHYPMDVVQKGATEQQRFELMQLAILQKARHLKILAVTSIAITTIFAITLVIILVLPENDVHLPWNSKEASQPASEQPEVKNFLAKKFTEITSRVTTHNSQNTVLKEHQVKLFEVAKVYKELFDLLLKISVHPEVQDLIGKLARLYQTQGEYDKALPLFLFQKTLVILEKFSSTQHPEVAIKLSHLANVYQAQGDYEKALSLSQRALSIREKTLGTEHSDVAANLNHLAELYRIQGKYNKAQPLYERALKIARKKLGKTHPETQHYMMNYLTLLEEIDKSKEKHSTLISKIKHFFTK